MCIARCIGSCCQWTDRAFRYSPGVEVRRVMSANEMYNACSEVFPTADIAIMAAAVADYAPKNYVDRKIKRETDNVDSIELVKNPDIAASLGAVKRPDQVLVGFALETDNAVEYGASKLVRKNLDAIVVNSLADKGAGFGTDTNKIAIIDREGHTTEFPLKSKREVATDIVDAIINL